MKPIPENLMDDLSATEQQSVRDLWAALETELPEPNTPAMRRRLMGLIWRERFKQWRSSFALGGFVTAMVLGLLIGRFIWLPTGTPAAIPGAPSLALETRLLQGATLAAQLQAVANLQAADQLPAEAVSALSALLVDDQSSMGLQLAALEALVTHGAQSNVQNTLTTLLNTRSDNPMIQARLKGHENPSSRAQSGSRT